jgi:hypothetical protein
VTPTDGLNKGINAVIAEFIAYRDLHRCDPTAVHKGGNTAIRDIELFDDHFWVNVKSGWYDGKGNLGHSPVNWENARDPESPRTQLDAVAVVVLRPGDLDINADDGGLISIKAPAYAHWYLIPASVLYEHGTRISAAAASVPEETAGPYLIDAEHPLSSARLDDILHENQIAKPSVSPEALDLSKVGQADGAASAPAS